MSGERQAVAQGAPTAGIDVSDFPEIALDETTEYFRAHTKPFDAHFRSSSGEGRFDLSPPRGTCYVAESITVAVREWIGPARRGRLVSAADRDRLQVTVLRELSGRAANVSASAASDFGITTELTSMTPYDVPRAWARLFDESGFDAVKYVPRFTPGGPTALGSFGPGGVGRVGEEVRRLAGDEALREAGLVVLPTPAAAKVSIV